MLDTSNIREDRHAPQHALHLLYHELRPQPTQYSYVVQNATFEEHLDFFSCLRRLTVRTTIPEITFDDGHISNFEYAHPLLRSRGLLAHFFITVGWTAKRSGYMGWSELRALQQAGHRIGAHGWTHTLLTHCTAKDLHVELIEARKLLEDKLGIAITTMSLPGGRSNRRVVEACREAGYEQIYTSVPKAELLPLGTTVGRLNIRGDISPASLVELCSPESPALAALERQYRVKSAAKALVGDRLYAKIWGLLNRAEPDTAQGNTSIHEDPAHHQ